MGTQVGTQKCAERAVEAVEAVHRDLLNVQRLYGSLFNALKAPKALNATLIRQDSVNLVERLHTNYPALISWMDVH